MYLCWYFENLADYYKSFINTSTFLKVMIRPEFLKLNTYPLSLDIDMNLMNSTSITYLSTRIEIIKLINFFCESDEKLEFKNPWIIRCTCTCSTTLLKDDVNITLPIFCFFVYINCNICALGSRLLSNLVVIWHRFLIDC